MEAVLAGSTGLVGRNILQQLLTSKSYTSVHAYTRRALPSEFDTSNATPIQTTETDTWPSLYPAASSKSEGSTTTTTQQQRVFYTALGTTRAQAGGLEAQRKIDYDLNLALARAAHASGVQTCVVISSASANTTSMIPYSKLKGQIEDDISALGFANTVILRPGLIMGTREDSRPTEAAIRKLAAGMKAISGGVLTNFWGQEADIIARAAINAAGECARGKREKGTWILAQADIIRWGTMAEATT